MSNEKQTQLGEKKGKEFKKDYCKQEEVLCYREHTQPSYLQAFQRPCRKSLSDRAWCLALNCRMYVYDQQGKGCTMKKIVSRNFGSGLRLNL